MNDALYVTINAIGTMLLLLMLFNFGSRNVISKGLDDRIFTIMLWVNMFLLITDTVMWLLNGNLSPLAGAVLRIDTVLYYISQPLICLIWFIYCELKLNVDMRKIIRQLPWLSIPTVAAAALTVASLFKPLFFYIGADNVYQRADLFFLGFGLPLLYIFGVYFIMLRMVLKDPKTPKRETIRFLYLYPILPVVCAVIQWLFYGVTILWIGSVISLLIIYFNLQNTLITTDVLTGLSNRRRFETYIESKLSAPIRHPLLFALMIDIDKFRDINNKFGHIMGDEALKNVAEIIKAAVSREDFIARVGGEEFVVIGERDNPELAFKTMQAIKDETLQFNEKKTAPYILSMSIGYAFIKNGERRTADEIIKEADKRMYNEKNRVDAEV
ncbi:MAG TPA: GGDEF domain-containing protein [Oscillospiraceae bacterium]|nr:GGDEF domain-containing protein [Oscillospiraceae bacterium]HPS34415.1 GGDEF domain-containing protein [Oscillospiraceae bacterium]